LAGAVLAAPGKADTANGNDFALYYSEAKTPKARAEVMAEHKDRPHFFRYLQVMEMERNEDGSAVSITAFEPASLMDVRFKVVKRESLNKLEDEPVTKPGDALALTGRVRSVVTNTVILGPVIIRHKDRIDPKRGKELLCEVDPTATFYSYTGGKRPVSLTAQDRDLLQFKDQIIAQGGKNAWGEFLERELAKRKKDRAAVKKEREAARKEAPAEKTAPAEEAEAAKGEQ
jgi:hypothetical protein